MGNKHPRSQVLEQSSIVRNNYPQVLEQSSLVQIDHTLGYSNGTVTVPIQNGTAMIPINPNNTLTLPTNGKDGRIKIDTIRIPDNSNVVNIPLVNGIVPLFSSVLHIAQGTTFDGGRFHNITISGGNIVGNVASQMQQIKQATLTNGTVINRTQSASIPTMGTPEHYTPNSIAPASPLPQSISVKVNDRGYVNIPIGFNAQMGVAVYADHTIDLPPGARVNIYDQSISLPLNSQGYVSWPSHQSGLQVYSVPYSWKHISDKYRNFLMSNTNRPASDDLLSTLKSVNNSY